MICEEKTWRLEEFCRLTVALSASVNKLAERVGAISKDDFDGMKRIADRARFHAEQARAAFERHVAEHGC